MHSVYIPNNIPKELPCHEIFKRCPFKKAFRSKFDGGYG